MMIQELAREFAIEAHGDQLYSGLPYVTHLDAVALLVSPCGPAVQAVAYLHDAIEDTETDLADISGAFGCAIEHMVWICTDAPGKTRRQRKWATNKKFAKVPSKWNEALVVKIADRVCNMRASSDNLEKLRMYRNEYDAFRKACYRKGWARVFWEELDRWQMT